MNAYTSLVNALNGMPHVAPFAVKGYLKGSSEPFAVATVFGDMTAVTADAYVVPHLRNVVTLSGVASLVNENGAQSGVRSYGNYVDGCVTNYVEQKWGDVFVAESGGGNSKHLIHIVGLKPNPPRPARPQKPEHIQRLESILRRSTPAKLGNPILTTKETLEKVMEIANEKQYERVVVPPIGNEEFFGPLDPFESARAIFEAVQTFWSKPSSVFLRQIVIAMNGDLAAYNHFEDRLSLTHLRDMFSQSYFKK